MRSNRDFMVDDHLLNLADADFRSLKSMLHPILAAANGTPSSRIRLSGALAWRGSS